MGRHLKPLKVEDFIDMKRRIQVDLMLDRNTKQFFAEVQLEKIEAPSIEQLREKVREKVAMWTPLEWRRVIEIEVGGEPNESSWAYRKTIGEHKAQVEVEFCRLELAQGMDGDWMQRPFAEDLNEDKREQQEHQPLKFAESCARWRMEKHVPFSDAAWLTLIEIDKAIHSARERLKKLCDPKEGGRLLATYQPPAVRQLIAAAAQADEEIPADELEEHAAKTKAARR